MESYFEKQGGCYLDVGGVYIPSLIAPQGQKRPIGRCGLEHLAYLKRHRRATYTTLKTTGRLNEYLYELDVQITEMVSRIVNQMAAADGTDEQLKNKNPMRWVGLMNNYKACAEEIVLRELAYT